jgi:hypothetical protein
VTSPHEPDAAEWAAAREARDQLLEALIDDPDVRLIDIGRAGTEPTDPGRSDSTPARQLVVRIHVSRPPEPNQYPSTINGFDVVVMPGDYEPGTT